MEVFKGYASFYDSLYQDKDYSSECDFLEKVFSKYCNKRIISILDLGCGTGNHSILLAERGYLMTGVDISKNMLSFAKEKNLQKNVSINFHERDIRNLSLKKKFDAVILMFAVVSYQVSNSDIRAVFKSIKQHLKPNGIFIFDCWYGPSVTHIKPSKRVKKVNNGNIEIIRIANPVLNKKNKMVTVNFTIYEKKANQILKTVKESHPQRFFFPEEINNFAIKEDLSILEMCPFLSLNKKLSYNDWYMAVIGTT